MTAPILIHIGMPKAGSTSLRMGLMCRCPEWEFVGIQAFGYRGAESEWGRQLYSALLHVCTAEESQYKRMRGELLALVEARPNKDRPLLISDEKLTTSHYFISSTPYADRTLVASRLADLFGEARILFVIRDQHTFLPSVYGQMLRSGSLPFMSYDRWINDQITRHRLQSPSVLPIAEYDTVVESYDRNFCESNVDVALFEDYVDDAMGIYQQIADRLNVDWSKVAPFVDPNPYRYRRPSRLELILTRLYQDFRVLGSIVPKPIRMAVLRASMQGASIDGNCHKAAKEYISTYYERCNISLSHRLGKSIYGVRQAELARPDLPRL